MAEKFKTGDLVWAKLEGHPYWPGKIASECITNELKSFKDEEGVAVLFFGLELTYGLVREDCIKNFEKNYKEYSRTKIKKSSKEDFEAALELAKKPESVEEPPLELDEEEEKIKIAKEESLMEENQKKMKMSPETEKENKKVEEETNNKKESNENMNETKAVEAKEIIGTEQKKAGIIVEQDSVIMNEVCVLEKRILIKEDENNNNAQPEMKD